MKFLTMILLTVLCLSTAQADDQTYRQACIDELQSEANKVCDDKTIKSVSTITGLFKNAGYISDTNDRVRRICSYHCPQDIAEACHAMLNQGPALIKAFLAGGPSAPSYSASCKAVQAKLDTARKAAQAMVADKAPAEQGESFAKGEFRKPSSSVAKAEKCNPYNESGAFVMGKCPN